MKTFDTFKNFKIFVTDINSHVPWFFKFNVNRASNVLWLNSKKHATFIKEKIFIKLFDNEQEINKVEKDSGNPKNQCNNDRIKTIKFLTSAKLLTLNEKVTNKTLSQMSDLLLLSGNKFKSVGPTQAFESLPQNTSSSFPDFASPKSKIKQNLLLQIHNMVRNNNFSFLCNLPISINWRTQVSNSLKLKYRQFYPFPVIIATLEKMLFYNLFNHFELNKKTPYCYSNTFVDLSHRYKKWQNNKYIYSLDFSSFDQHINNQLLKLILEFIFRKISPTKVDKSIFNAILEYHLNSIIISSINNKTCAFRKRKGLMSGSALTNLLGSFINLFMILYLNTICRLEIDVNSISILGDDIIFCSQRKLSVEFLSVLFDHHFGMIVSPEKSQIFLPKEKVYFLGHYFDSDGRYIDFKKTRIQLVFSQTFISEDVLSTEDRIFGKFCSILFKCVEGNDLFEKYIIRLRSLLRADPSPGFFYSIFNDDGNMFKKLDFEYYKTQGWRLQ